VKLYDAVNFTFTFHHMDDPVFVLAELPVVGPEGCECKILSFDAAVTDPVRLLRCIEDGL
jgi:hypothetical protein